MNDKVTDLNLFRARRKPNEEVPQLVAVDPTLFRERMLKTFEVVSENIREIAMVISVNSRNTAYYNQLPLQFQQMVRYSADYSAEDDYLLFESYSAIREDLCEEYGLKDHARFLSIAITKAELDAALDDTPEVTGGIEAMHNYIQTRFNRVDCSFVVVVYSIIAALLETTGVKLIKAVDSSEGFHFDFLYKVTSGETYYVKCLFSFATFILDADALEFCMRTMKE